MKKNILLLLIFLSNNIIYAQKASKTPKLGQTTSEELSMKFYENDSTARAVVLEEKGYSYIDDKHNFDFRRDIYRRIKLFDKSEFNRATIEINLFEKEQVKYIEAITYNIENGKTTKIHLLDNQIFKKQLSEKWSQVTFTLPNIKEGSVIEYRYSLLSPYSKIDDWNFQEDIPKVSSDFTSSFPGNWKYNIRFRSDKELDRKNSYIKRGCIQIGGLGEGDCAIMEYGMDNIPAFEKEDFMLSEENFKSKLIFEPLSFTQTNGVVKKYTKTWKDADKTLRLNFLDAQTSKKGYFKKNLPQNLFSISSDTERAKEVFKHIQDKLSWNKKYRTNTLRVKEIYQNNTGGIDGINLVLYNSLQAANIESYVVALSTRNNGVLTKLHPSITEFNYFLVKAVIDNKTYFLDATDKNLIFGEVPFKCLNGEVRVFDFKKGSYWELLKPKYISSLRNNISLQFNEDSGMTGDIISTERGYYALKKRRKLQAKTEEEYLEEFETKNPLVEVNKFELISKKNDIVKTSYSISIPDFTADTDIIKLNPFLLDKISKNPFKLKERNYPVDFGYAWSESFSIRITTPKGYKISKLPDDKTLALPNNGGKLIFKINKTDQEIIVFMKYSLHKAIYTNNEYFYLKEYFKHIIEAQDSYIEFVKS